MVEGLLLDLVDFFELFTFPFVVVLFPPILASLSYYDIREVVVSQLGSFDIAHEYSF